MLRGIAVVLIRVLAIWTFVSSWSYWGNPLYYQTKPVYYFYLTIPAILALLLWVLAIPISKLMTHESCHADQSPQIESQVLIQGGTFFIGLVLSIVGVAELMIFVPQFLELTSEFASQHDRLLEFDLFDYYYGYKLDSFAKLGIGIVLIIFYRRFGHHRESN
jgi:uncharacterized membrane protein